MTTKEDWERIHDNNNNEKGNGNTYRKRVENGRGFLSIDDRTSLHIRLYTGAIKRLVGDFRRSIVNMVINPLVSAYNRLLVKFHNK